MHVDRCRLCDRASLHLILDLGQTALANRFIDPAAGDSLEPVFPLRLVICQACGLVQIDEQVDPAILFEDYVYLTGTSDQARAHADYLAQRFFEDGSVRPDDLVVELASNDGTVLKAFQKRGARVLGVEPARNIAARATAEGVETLCEFFGQSVAPVIRKQHGPARLVLARHVLAHVPDLRGFTEGMKALLAGDGLAVVEVPHLLPFYRNLEYDTIYHEHLSYFSLRVLVDLANRCGLQVVDVEEVTIHGGSILVTMQQAPGPRRVSARVTRILEAEEQAGLATLAAWRSFAQRVEQSRAALVAEVDRLREAGQRLAGYGAPAKGMTLLSYCGIGADRLAYLVDKNRLKQGKQTPGHRIPIHPPEKLLYDRPDVVLLLAWNFADEILAQQSDYTRRGGRWLLPIPLAHYR